MNTNYKPDMVEAIQMVTVLANRFADGWNHISEDATTDMAKALRLLIAAAKGGDVPLCLVHKNLDDKAQLVLTVGDCLACALHERVALLDRLATVTPDEPYMNYSLNALNHLIEKAGIEA